MFESIFSVVTIIAVVTVLVFYLRAKKKDGKDWIYAVYFLTILLTGAGIYSMGLSYGEDRDTAFSWMFVVSKSLGITLRAFTGDFNAASVSALAKARPLFTIAVFVHFIATIILAFLIVIKLFGQNVVNRFWVYWMSSREKYIAIGASGQAGIFLRSFDSKKRRRITVVLEPKHKDIKKDLIARGFNVVVIKDDEDNGERYETGKNRDTAKEEVKDALTVAGLYKNKNKTQVIAMSESDEVNLLVAMIVKEHIAGSIKPVKNDKGKFVLTAEQEENLEAMNLFAHIMYSELERTEHFAFADSAFGRITFFNPYEVRARKFMLENPITALIPAEWINTKRARLYSAKESGRERDYRIGNIFVGYGYTNQYLLPKSICNYQLLGMDYNALVIDRDAKTLEKRFQNAAPGLFPGGTGLMPDPDGTIYYPDPEEKYNIAFADLNVLSCDFYNRIVSEIEGSNGYAGYDFATVVISLGTDKLSVETALELRHKLYEKRLLKGHIDGAGAEYDRVRIFVKIQERSVLTDPDLLNENNIDGIITVFGETEEILNEEHIIQEKLDVIARNIANDYWKIATRGAMDAGAQRTNHVTKWDTLSAFKRESNRYAAMAIRTKLNLLGFELKDGAGDTDAETAQAYRAAYGTEVADRQRAEKDSGGKFIDFVERGADGKIIDNARNNLARLEHQRWNTMHLASGWTKLPISEVTAAKRQDEKARQHACITTFEGLDVLRERQAEDAVAVAKAAGEELTMDRARCDADTVCYDFDVMDRLLGDLEGSGFCVVRR